MKVLATTHRSRKIVYETLISGPCWSVVAPIGHYCPSATSSANATNWYGLLIMVGGDFSQTPIVVLL